ncbi:MAG: trypsin-like serine protease [Akkermansiaceae bacterium]|nr:trypsin-like serine protease [Akkermansiaceae bacterium]
MFRYTFSMILLSLASVGLHAKEPIPPSAITKSLAAPPSAPSDIYKSVLRIEVATQVPDYETPWNSGRFSGGIGTGFLIGKNKILTNAHVVSNSRRILITVYGSPKKYPAKVEYIAHDCDLALLSVEDPSDLNPSLSLTSAMSQSWNLKSVSSVILSVASACL